MNYSFHCFHFVGVAVFTIRLFSKLHWLILFVWWDQFISNVTMKGTEYWSVSFTETKVTSQIRSDCYQEKREILNRT